MSVWTVPIARGVADAATVNIGRPFDQRSAATAASATVPGLEIIADAAGAELVAWTTGVLWVNDRGGGAPVRLLVQAVSESLPLADDNRSPGPGFDTPLGRAWQTIDTVEAVPAFALYESSHRDATRAAVRVAATRVAESAGKNPKTWPDMLRTKLPDGRQFGTAHQAAKSAADRAAVLDAWLDASWRADGTWSAVVPVSVGDAVGRAPDLPVARHLFTLFDIGGQPVDPLWVFSKLDAVDPDPTATWFHRVTLLPAAQMGRRTTPRVAAFGVIGLPTTAVTDALPGLVLRTPPGRNSIAVARPLVPLAEWHSYPVDAPSSKLEWQTRADGALVQRLMPKKQATTPPTPTNPTAAPNFARRTTALTTFWSAPLPDNRGADRPFGTTFGDVVARCSDRLQVPCEVIIGIIGCESGLTVSGLATRFEPLRTRFEDPCVKAGVSEATLDAYRKFTSTGGKLSGSAVVGSAGRATVPVNFDKDLSVDASTLPMIGSRLFVDGRRMAIRNAAGAAVGNKKQVNLEVELDSVQGRLSLAPLQTFPPAPWYLPLRGGPPATTAAAAHTALPAGVAHQLTVSVTFGGPAPVPSPVAPPSPLTVTLVVDGVKTSMTCSVSNTIAGFGVAVATGPVGLGSRACLVVEVPGSAPAGVAWVLTHAPALTQGVDVSVDDGRSFSDLAPFDLANPANVVDPSVPELTVGGMAQIFEPTRGGFTSPGSMQATVRTAHHVLSWLRQRSPDFLADILGALGTTAAPLVRETLDGVHGDPAGTSIAPEYWLRLFNGMLDPSISIAIGTANLRRNYEQRGTRFDMPAAASGYNTGSPGVNRGTDFGLPGVVGYPGSASVYFNVARTLFSQPAFTPPSDTDMVRFVP